jgi:hypothetical protein
MTIRSDFVYRKMAHLIVARLADGHGTPRPLKCRICPAIIGAVIGNCPSG